MKGMQKISRGSGFRGAVSYALGNEHGRLIGGNMAGSDGAELTAEFAQVRSLRPDIGRPVWHNALRLPQGDRLDDAKWQQIADDYMAKMGFTDLHPRVYVLHDEPKGQHIHIIASRVGLDSSVFLGRNENLISTRKIAELEKVHGLTITPGPTRPAQKRRLKKAEVERANRTGEAPARQRLQDAVDQALGNGQTVTGFVAALRASGVSIAPNFATTGRLNGFSFGVDGVWLKGSDLGKAYTVAGLKKRGLDYEKERDFAALNSPDLIDDDLEFRPAVQPVSGVNHRL